MKRFSLCLSANVVVLLMLATTALADAENDHGEGWYGETTDTAVTNAGFILIAFFPTFILLASLLMWRLEKRKDTRKSAEKARLKRADARGGW